MNDAIILCTCQMQLTQEAIRKCGNDAIPCKSMEAVGLAAEQVARIQPLWDQGRLQSPGGFSQNAPAPGFCPKQFDFEEGRQSGRKRTRLTTVLLGGSQL